MNLVRRTLRRVRRKWDEALSDADHHFALFGRLTDGVRQSGLWPLEGRRVLDIGCGDRAAQTLLFATVGAEVHGIDVLPVRLGWQRPLMWVETAVNGRFAEWPSLQGGHHADWHDLAEDPHRAVPPWDHLRGRKHPLPVYCNGWRETQYREVFEREMVVERWEEGRLAGAEYLTPSIRAELGEYTERELLLLSVTVWARKRCASAASVPSAQLVGHTPR